jgi:DNA (cytosine-5)-methyltransferase 3A
MNGINVLSLFDGMSCGQQALERCGIVVNNYFASEIDKHAIAVTMYNYPNTKQLGSVIDVDGYKLPKIDLLIGGSPCQSFSFAGKRKGMATKCETEILTLEHYLELKQEGYEFEGQSYLFWEYMRLLNEVKPKYFLLENVEMGEKWERVLSKAIGVNGIHINSSLLSAQNRKRIYWTNIGMKPSGLFGDLESIIQQPKDKAILLKDILESEVDEKYYLSEKAIERFLRSEGGERCINNDFKSFCLNAVYYKQGRDNQLIVHNTMPRSGDPTKGGTGHLSRSDGKTYCLDTGNTNAVEIRKIKRIGGLYDQVTRWGIYDSDGISPTITASMGMSGGHVPMIKQINLSKESGGKQPYQQNRVYDVNGITPALCAFKSDLIINTSRIRRLTPLECERLQTVKDNFTSIASDSQRYKMLGNGWTVDVVAHIFSYLTTQNK